MKIYISGQILDDAEAKVSVLDHGLLYGDGVFEGIRIYSGNVFRLREHLERLVTSAKAIMLDLPWSIDQLEEAIAKTCHANDLRDGYIRMVVTRGKGSLGLSPDSCKTPELIIIADQIKIHTIHMEGEGIKVMTAAQRQMPADVFPAQVKSLNYVKNVCAQREAKLAGYDDALILNAQGYVTEAVVENVFIVKEGELWTPPISAGALPGITRQAFMDVAGQLNISVREELFTRYDVWSCDECFLTGTAAEMVPVTNVDGRSIGSGVVGEISKKLHAGFKELVKTDGYKL